jgi:hypothetical protein
MRRVVLSIAVLFWSVGAIAGPFGLEMGQPVSQLQIVKTLKENEYEIQVPKTNSTFEKYLAIATKENGLCKVLAIGVANNLDSNGDRVKMQFGTLSAALEEKYGAPQTFDHLESGSVWQAPTQFAMGLYQNERTLAKFWTGKLPDNIQSIALQAAGLSISATNVTLGYEFSNLDQCESHTQEKDKSAL